ncbi:murein hydrolase activator EnvC family protein [Streptomyces sp. NPDC049040]|uniref:murein hydrolase activator EnvC family protein n=1 Tax=Streptomyces sp. NPDC049040 TaxID=3365593 RepID=UPI00371B5B35
MAFTVVWLTVVAALLAGADGGAPAGSTRADGGAPTAAARDDGGAAAPGSGTGARSGAGDGSGTSAPAGGRSWPVSGPGPRGRPMVLRTFDPPATQWGAGHRGVDLRAGPGAAVRAAAPGEVVFAGQVGGTGVLVLRIGPSLRISYEPVRASVPVGARVAAGQQVGLLEGGLAHCPGDCLHWGLLRSGPDGDVYLDPLSLLPAWMRRSGPSRLLPVHGVAAPA